MRGAFLFLLCACGSPPKAVETIAVPPASAAPTSSAKLERRDIQEAMRGHFKQFGRCFDLRHAQDATISGRVELVFTIAADGHVIREPSEGDPALVTCLEVEMQQLEFPPSSADEHVRYPFVFHAEQHVATDGSGSAFDRGAAAHALTVDLSSCKGAVGTGHVQVTFATDGSVSKVDVDLPPFKGTAQADCIAEKYRAVKIPAFAGAPVTVGKSFSIK